MTATVPYSVIRVRDGRNIHWFGVIPLSRCQHSCVALVDDNRRAALRTPKSALLVQQSLRSRRLIRRTLSFYQGSGRQTLARCCEVVNIVVAFARIIARVGL